LSMQACMDVVPCRLPETQKSMCDQHLTLDEPCATLLEMANDKFMGVNDLCCKFCKDTQDIAGLDF
jgi:hypothetical protein